jgi:dihydroneopterin aldolase
MNIVTRQLIISDLEFLAPIGAYQSETQGRQRIRVNAVLDVRDPTGAIDDRLSAVVDYAKVIEAIRAISEKGHINLVETFAEQAVSACFRFDGVMAVDIRIEKPDARADAATVGCRLRATR